MRYGMKKRMALALFSVLMMTGALFAQQPRTQTSRLTATSSATKIGLPLDLRASGINNHYIIWNASGTVATCSVKVQQSVDGVVWTDLIAGATCTSNGQSSLTAGVANYIRVNATTLTGSGTLTVTYTGFPPGTPVTATIDTTGLATSAKQDTGNTSLASIAAAVVPVSSACAITTTASTNSTSCKGSAGNRLGGWIINTTATVYYLRFYNTASAPTCSSATGFIISMPIPAATTGAGITYLIPAGVAFATGYGYCITASSTSTANDNAAAGIFGELFYN